MRNMPILDAPKFKVPIEGTKEPRAVDSQLKVLRKRGDGGMRTGTPQDVTWKQRRTRLGQLGTRSS